MTPSKKAFRIIVVDDHPILRQGIARFISEQRDFEVVGEASDASAALALVQRVKPDGVVLDVSLKGASGLEAAKNIISVRPETKILMLSMHDENLYAERALKAGALGYVMKQESPDAIFVALKKVMNGDIHVSARLENRLLSGLATHKGQICTSPVDVLTDRELEVFEGLGSGMGTRQIAEKLKISMKTVETYRRHIKEKLGFQSSPEMVLFATQWMRPGRSDL